MKHLAILAAIVVVAACGPTDNTATVGDTVGGAVTPGAADTGMMTDTMGTGGATGAGATPGTDPGMAGADTGAAAGDTT